MKRHQYHQPKRKPPAAINDNTFHKQLNRALDLLNRYALEEGLQIIQELTHTHPEHHDVQYALGAYHLLKGEYHQAIEHFNRAIDLKPDFAQAYFNKAAAHQQLMEVKQTIRAFQHVVEFGDPHQGYVRQAQDFLTGFENLIADYEGVSMSTYLEGGDEFDNGVECLKQHDWHAAISHFERSLALTPRHPQTYCNIGLCYLHVGRKQDALDAFDKALEIDPNYELAHVNRQMAISLQEGETPPSDIPFVNYYGETWKEMHRE